MEALRRNNTFLNFSWRSIRIFKTFWFRIKHWTLNTFYSQNVALTSICSFTTYVDWFVTRSPEIVLMKNTRNFSLKNRNDFKLKWLNCGAEIKVRQKNDSHCISKKWNNKQLHQQFVELNDKFAKWPIHGMNFFCWTKTHDKWVKIKLKNKLSSTFCLTSNRIFYSILHNFSS